MGVVKIKYLNVYSGLTGKKEERIEIFGKVVLKHFLEKVFITYGAEFRKLVLKEEDQLNPHVWLLVNQKRVTDLGLEIRNGDVVVFSFPVAGG
jgi:MoaD family protein